VFFDYFALSKDRLMQQLFSLSIVLTILFSCTEKPKIYLAQGLMAGEATDSSVILQSRLAATDTLVDGDIPGIHGMARFGISQKSSLDASIFSDWIFADSTNDYLVRHQFTDLSPATTYYYYLEYGINKNLLHISPANSFATNAGRAQQAENSFVVVTGMNYYHHHYGKYDSLTAYQGADKGLGYPALVAISDSSPDYFIGTGDNVYFDHPSGRSYSNAIKRGKAPHPGTYEGKEVVDEAGMRKKYHEQFSQKRFRDLFATSATYWEKDDHDYRMNDADPFSEFPISHKLGIKNFREQLPVVCPANDGTTYRTRRINKDLQLWFVEGRDYRDANDREPGPEKTLWGAEQLAWIKSTLLESDATFKLLISPTPMVGPDDAYKKDNHVNPLGFRHEGDAFFAWLVEHDFLNKHFYIVCGDRHWQYHAQHPLGIEEFSCGALVDNNSRAGRLAGDPKSTDPEALIKQYYVQGTAEEATGGFLYIKNTVGEHPQLHFEFYDDMGSLLYKHVKTAL
jgi:alkaline phosphatase D